MKKRMYYCRALTKTYQLQYFNCIASSHQNAQNYLLENDFWPLTLRQGALLSPRHFKTVDLLILTSQLHHLLSAGIPLFEALSLLMLEQKNKYWRAVLHRIQTYLRNGSLFSSTLDEFPMVFPKFYRTIMMTGDNTGQLIQCQNNILVILEKQIYLKKKIMKGLRYPLFLIGMLFIISIIIIQFLFPQFKHIYDTFGATLPPFTQFIFNLMLTLQDIVIPASIFVISLHFVSYYVFFRRPIYSLQLGLSMLPKIGIILKQYYLHFIFQHLALTQKAGMPLLPGLKLAQNHMGFLPYRQALKKIIALLEQGESLSASIKQSYLFPALCHQYIRVAEEIGDFEEMFEKLSEYYQQQTENALENSISLIEPILIFFLCIVVGSIMLALYFPIANLGEIVL